MSLFERNFNENRKTKDEAVTELREALAEVCETFALAEQPMSRKRGVLMRELRRLADHYQEWRNWSAK